MAKQIECKAMPHFSIIKAGDEKGVHSIMSVLEGFEEVTKDDLIAEL